jgi:hypothetical protein
MTSEPRSIYILALRNPSLSLSQIRAGFAAQPPQRYGSTPANSNLCTADLMTALPSAARMLEIDDLTAHLLSLCVLMHSNPQIQIELFNNNN